MMIAKRTTGSEAETMDVAASLAARLRGDEIIALEGPLGAGKTCFVRGLARGLGLDAAAVSSPTFIICREYEPAAGGRGVTLVHIDAYRLHGAGELETIGWDELVSAMDTVIAIEWAGRIGDALPPERRIDVSLAHADEKRRAMAISAAGEMAKRLEGFDGQAESEI